MGHGTPALKKKHNNIVESNGSLLWNKKPSDLCQLCVQKKMLVGVGGS